MQTKMTPTEAGLSERSIEYLRLIGKGKKNREIADAMSITVDAVYWHRMRAVSRLSSTTGKRRWTRKELAAWITANDPGEEYG